MWDEIINPVARAQFTFQMLTLLKKKNIYIYIYRQIQYSKTWDSKYLAMIAQKVRPFGMNPKVGVRVPLRSRHFLFQKLWHFHKNICSCVENEYCCPNTVNISNDNFTSKISIPSESVFQGGPDVRSMWCHYQCLEICIAVSGRLKYLVYGAHDHRLSCHEYGTP